LPFTCRGENEISENIFATTEFTGQRIFFFALIRDGGCYFWIISQLVDRIFNKNLARARKERQIAPQASAGFRVLSPLLAFRKAQRGRE